MRRLLLVLLAAAAVGLVVRGAVPCSLLTVQPRCTVALHPGPTADTSTVIEIVGERTFASSGSFLLTTVAVDADLDLAEWLRSGVSPRVRQVPRATLYPPGETVEQVRQANVEQMDDSESTAATAALRALGRRSGTIDVRIDAGSVGGPSAGLVFALAIFDALVAEDLTGGRVIAGTGTIDAHGTVGAVGGIRQKVLGAIERAPNEPASVFLVPRANLEEARGAPVTDDIVLVPVGTLDEAIAALRDLADGRQPADAVALAGTPRT